MQRYLPFKPQHEAVNLELWHHLVAQITLFHQKKKLLYHRKLWILSELHIYIYIFNCSAGKHMAERRFQKWAVTLLGSNTSQKLGSNASILAVEIAPCHRSKVFSESF